jgi:hypothetical protein
VAQGYATNLASEFLVLSTLYRLGFDASLTLSNKKAVDIAVILDEGRAVTIDVKANAGKNDWLLGDGEVHSAANHFFVLVSFENRFRAVEEVPRCWVFPASHLLPFVKTSANGKTRYVSRRAILNDGGKYEGAWELLQTCGQ